MGVVSEAAKTVAENAVTSTKLRIKILVKKPEIGPCEVAKQVSMVTHMDKPTVVDNHRSSVTGNVKLKSSALGTKRKRQGELECHIEKKMKMDRSATLNCQVILGKLIKHNKSYPFIQPVDPVALCIPDYFDVIKHPMDLGTIKQRLDRNVYSDVEEFESDVKLTFSNAMLYNPPNNFVHQFAKELMLMFDNLWKPLKGKINRQHESKRPRSSENGVCKTRDDLNRKRVNSDLLSDGDKLPGQTMSQEKDHGGLKEEPLKKGLQSDPKAVKDGKAKGPKSSKTCKCDPESDACIGPVSPSYEGSAGPISAHLEILTERPVKSNVKINPENAKEVAPTKKVAHNVVKDVEVKNTSTSKPSRSDPDSDGAVSCVDEEHTYPCSPVTTGSIGAPNEGLENELDIQLSPSKALRAARLRSRFADTILKAQHKTLLQPGGGTDPVKLQQEKERMEKKQREEKARIEAQLKAVEAAARSKAEADLKKRREQEREAARLELEKMERSVDLDDNFHVLRELESLVGDSLTLVCHDRKTRMVWEQIDIEKLRSPLERLGLFIKEEDDTDDYERFLEGDWEEGEVVF